MSPSKPFLLLLHTGRHLTAWWQVFTHNPQSVLVHDLHQPKCSCPLLCPRLRERQQQDSSYLSLCEKKKTKHFPSSAQTEDSLQGNSKCLVQRNEVGSWGLWQLIKHSSAPTREIEAHCPSSTQPRKPAMLPQQSCDSEWSYHKADDRSRLHSGS